MEVRNIRIFEKDAIFLEKLRDSLGLKGFDFTMKKIVELFKELKLEKELKWEKELHLELEEIIILS